jgi:hypothetical protein
MMLTTTAISGAYSPMTATMFGALAAMLMLVSIMTIATKQNSARITVKTIVTKAVKYVRTLRD